MRVQGKTLLKDYTFFQLISQYRDLELGDIIQIDWGNRYIVKSISKAENLNYIKYSLINMEKDYKIYLTISKENTGEQYIIYNNLKNIIRIDNNLVTINNKRLPKNSDYYIKYINKYKIYNLFDITKIAGDEIDEI